jgi:2',3'-cyclic-nucleotide 2'-phosphodiesterase/3'-nucleotidase
VKRRLSLPSLLSSLLGLFLLLAGPAARTGQSPSTPPEKVTLTLLRTTDSHGHIEPWDYYANKPANLGLAKIETLIRQVRAGAPNVVLLDCGDTIQGTPLAFYYARKDTAAPNPTITVMNAMRYDAMAVGNHEFNFGLDVLWKAKRESKFPWLAANLRQTYRSGVPYIRPYVIRRLPGCVSRSSASSRPAFHAGKFRSTIEATPSSRLWMRPGA